MARYFSTQICRRRFVWTNTKVFCYNNCCEKEMVDFTDKVKSVVFAPLKNTIKFPVVINYKHLLTVI